MLRDTQANEDEDKIVRNCHWGEVIFFNLIILHTLNNQPLGIGNVCRSMLITKNLSDPFPL